MDVMSFFFNDTATTEIYTLSLHDALPISDTDIAGLRDLLSQYERQSKDKAYEHGVLTERRQVLLRDRRRLEAEQQRVSKLKDRKSTRLNSSHANISYAVFCLKKKKSRLSP